MTELINSLETFSDAGAVARPKLTVAGVHARHGEFIWKTLYRMGVRAPHLEDVYQEVFLVVHRRLDSYAGHCAITTWLFEVCFRVAAGYRRRAETGSNAAVVLAAIGVTGVVLVAFAVDTLRNAPETFSAIVGIAALSVALDLLWKWARNRGGRGARSETAPTA